eukprot:1297536-Prorocentrum_lima.AAC.1
MSATGTRKAMLRLVVRCADRRAEVLFDERQTPLVPAKKVGRTVYVASMVVGRKSYMADYHRGLA